MFSFGLGLISTFGIFQPNETIKTLAKSAIGFSVAGVVLGEVLTCKVLTETDKFTNQHDDLAKSKSKELTALIKQKESDLITLTQQLATTKQANEFNTANIQRLEKELIAQKEILNQKSQELTIARDLINNLKTKLADVGKFSQTEAYQIVRKTYDRSVKKLEGLLDALIRNHPEIREDIQPIYIEVDSFQTRYLQKLNEYETCENFAELLDIGLELQEKIIDKCVELKVKAQTILIRYLENIYSDSIPYVEFETHLNDLAEKAGKQIELNQRAIASEWVTANEQHVQRYETEFTEVLTTGKYALSRMQDMETQLETLQQELSDLRKPLQFTGTIDYAVAGNAIIGFYFKAYGYCLDAIAWQETETGYTLTFATARNKIYLTADMLHDKDNRPQLAGLTNALDLPTFTPNYQSGLMVLEVTTRKPAKKKPSTEADINKLWIPASKFEETVKGWSRVRLTGGSESGKSPTAENLAVCILKNRSGTAKLFNPQHDSIKNYWTIPVVGTTHTHSEKGISELAKLVDDRARDKHAPKSYELYVFDEIDSTMSHTKGKKSAIGSDVNFVIKQASHQNLGAIFIGQNANVSEYPGMDRSDWNSAVNVHIGSNAYDAITNSNLFTTEMQSKLKEKADRLSEYCEFKNDELGLDKTDPNTYRFALVIEPNKKPYFIELPAFGQYTYTEILQFNSGTTLSNQVANLQPTDATTLPTNASNPDSTVATLQPTSGYVGVACPKCKKGILRTPKKIRGINNYPCDSCGKTTSENVLMVKLPDV